LVILPDAIMDVAILLDLSTEAFECFVAEVANLKIELDGVRMEEHLEPWSEPHLEVAVWWEVDFD
jgi:hypothetical protein